MYIASLCINNTLKRLAVVRSKMTKDKEEYLTITILELFLDVAQRSGCLYCLSRTSAKVDPRDYKIDS